MDVKEDALADLRSFLAEHWGQFVEWCDQRSENGDVYAESVYQAIGGTDE